VSQKIPDIFIVAWRRIIRF